MFAVIWDYSVRPGCEAAFEALYGADGAWVVLFSAQTGYVATELLRDQGSRRYLTIDRWDTAAHYDVFVSAERDRYAAIDAEGDQLTEGERRIGRFSTDGS